MPLITVSALTIFFLGTLGFIFTSKGDSSLLKLVLCLELILLGATLLVLVTSWQFNDLDGVLFALYLIVLAGVESIVGLTLIIQYYALDKSLL